MSDYDSVEWAVVGLVTTSVSVVGIIGNTAIIVFYKNTDTFTTLVRWLAVIDTVFVVGISFCQTPLSSRSNVAQLDLD